MKTALTAACQTHQARKSNDAMASARQIGRSHAAPSSAAVAVAAGSAEAVSGISPFVTYGAYEASYALRYIAIELFFRGFLLLGLERFLGRAVLMPMVTLYAFWHFGKPLPEAIGSIFAGYILGVIALRTRSIIGGIIVHVGVALGMDLAAHLQGAAPR